ncbi:hypercellular protein-like protein HypA [Sporormia fimetaria CBS 119925]|uniref:Hypercellular protein-like protein HypA n=1 Tax=Sporormia fimetaria CBS 119925 TaxID=1340428 RepID=A0A6A6V3T4_9PLEO|nr:hypercellular protein-like protein HypA [Sporormia fimetaria CBS 119925]
MRFAESPSLIDRRADMFSPLAWPGGTLLYHFSTSLPPTSQLSLSPFELFREPLVVIGIGDAAEYPWLATSRDDKNPQNPHGSDPEDPDAGQDDIQNSLKSIREQYPKAYLHTLMMFDSTASMRHPVLPEETILVPPVEQQKTTTMKTIVCDISSMLLAEMTTLARSIQALPTVPSPASQTNTNGTPSWASSDIQGSQFGRRNSQVPIASRPESPGPGQKELHRMSMPVLPSSASGPLAVDDPRAASPGNQGTRTPPTTFDEMQVANSTAPLGRTNSTSSKPVPATRDASADRVSIHGFGSGGVGERARNKGRGRVSIVIGSLYLCAGQWPEALRELTEGAARARSLSDHLWHAKALENILVCLLLFAWAGMDFQIPQVCNPTGDKSSGTKSPSHTPSNSITDVAAIVPPPTSHELALENLNSLIPDLVNMILNIYNRASNFSGESLPPLAFSECVIRFSKLLTAMNLSAGFLDEDALQHLVRNTSFRQKPRLSVPRLSVNPTRNDIANMLFRALPAPSDGSGMSPTDRVVVLAGVASVLSALGLQRKKAIVMREFVTSLIPGLVQARKVGAAEMGVHPAAGLAALNMASSSVSGAGALNLGEGEVENGIDEFLGLLGRIYGIPGSKASFGHRTNAEDSKTVVEEILKMSSLRSFGSLSLKLDVLRICINFCEALPDFNGVLHFTALLLRVAGPGTAPKPNSTDVFVSLPRDEQARLYANISRTVAAANKLGIQHIHTEYWDDFLIRGIHIVEEATHLRLTHHKSTVMKAASTGKDGPFLHNPWIKRPTSDPESVVLVANERYRFIIALQNPYDFELEVESLRIAADGVEFEALEQYFILGPYRTQKFPINGVARSSGTLTISGCYVKAAGCRERFFPIFPEPWRPENEAKMKKIGLSACLGAPLSRPASAVEPPTEGLSSVAPKAETLTYTVIPEQPLLTLVNVSLRQGALMILEGERQRFTITLKNTSASTAVDFVHLTFQDSARAAIEASTSNRDLPAAELHELEVQLSRYPSLKWIKEQDEETISIQPGESHVFEIEVYGRTRLTEALVQFDYANLGKRRSEIKDRFFTRQLSVPISITVNASVQLQRPDILPLSGDFGWSSEPGSPPTVPTASLSNLEDPSSTLLNQNDTHFQAFLRHQRSIGAANDYCMLLLDLRNSWPNPLSISLQVRGSALDEDSSDDSWDHFYTVDEVIQPGHVDRVTVIFPKIHLEDPHASVPSLNHANQRQFVVSASKISPEAERATREAFWYRQALLKLIRGTWKEASNGRHGDIELRSIRFSPRMVEAIRLDDVDFQMTVTSDDQSDTGVEVAQLRRAKFRVPVDEFLTLKTTIYNRSQRPISPLLRLQPHLAGLPHEVALDLDKRFSWTGVLQRKLPVVQPGQSVDSELGFVALCAGVFEIGATVDEIEILDYEEKSGNRQRSGTGASVMQGSVLGEPRLRSWYLKEPCTIVASRNDD